MQIGQWASQPPSIESAESWLDPVTVGLSADKESTCKSGWWRTGRIGNPIVVEVDDKLMISCRQNRETHLNGTAGWSGLVSWDGAKSNAVWMQIECQRSSLVILTGWWRLQQSDMRPSVTAVTVVMNSTHRGDMSTKTGPQSSEVCAFSRAFDRFVESIKQFQLPS